MCCPDATSCCGGDTGEKGSCSINLTEVLDRVRNELSKCGFEFESCCEGATEATDGRKVKVVCVAPDLRSQVDELGRSTRGQVVMVRVDEDTSRRLDAWVETGAVKSRSEAAALFIREGLKVRAAELQRLEAALGEVESAKARLRARAQEIFGESESGPDKDPAEPQG